MTTEQQKLFDLQYTRRGSRILKTIEDIQSAITDFPADSSCGANWSHMGSLAHIGTQLDDILKFINDETA